LDESPTTSARRSLETARRARRFGKDLQCLTEKLHEWAFYRNDGLIPEPLLYFDDICNELSDLQSWWHAVRRGDRTIADGPPGGPPSAYGPE
jgi:hypothetical protein